MQLCCGHTTSLQLVVWNKVSVYSMQHLAKCCIYHFCLVQYVAYNLKLHRVHSCQPSQFGQDSLDICPPVPIERSRQWVEVWSQAGVWYSRLHVCTVYSTGNYQSCATSNSQPPAAKKRQELYFSSTTNG